MSINVLAITYTVAFFMISCQAILTDPISHSLETFFNMVSLISLQLHK